MFPVVFHSADHSADIGVYAETGETEDPAPPKEYTIIFNGMGTKVSPPVLTVSEGSAYGELPVPVKEFYEFKGWFTDPIGGTEIKADSIVKDPVSKYLYARWEGCEITLTLDPARANLSSNKCVVNYGGDFSTLPIPTRKGLIFMGWYTKKTSGTRINPSDKVSTKDDINLYAKWAPVWYLQKDKRWGKKWYRVRKEKSTVGNAGCGPSAMAMVVSSLKNAKVTPDNACKWSKNKKYKAYLSGTKDEFFKAYGKKYGICVNKIGTYDLRHTKKSKSAAYHKKAKSEVSKGNWVIALVGKGKWTGGSGHFILWYKNEGDYALIRDPNSKNKDRAKAKISTLQKQVKRYWIINVPDDKKVN